MAKFNPFVLSLSSRRRPQVNDASGLGAWFDKLTTNGNSDKFSTNGLSTSLETNGGM